MPWPMLTQIRHGRHIYSWKIYLTPREFPLRSVVCTIDWSISVFYSSVKSPMDQSSRNIKTISCYRWKNWGYGGRKFQNHRVCCINVTKNWQGTVPWSVSAEWVLLRLAEWKVGLRSLSCAVFVKVLEGMCHRQTVSKGPLESTWLGDGWRNKSQSKLSERGKKSRSSLMDWVTDRMGIPEGFSC